MAPGADTGRRNRGGPYIYIKRPECPLAESSGWIAEHRYVTWAAGVLTDPSLHVHHLNGDKHDNRLENLQVLTASEHSELHGKVKAAHCRHGHEWTPANTFIRKNGKHRECRECMRLRSAQQRAKGKVAA